MIKIINYKRRFSLVKVFLVLFGSYIALWLLRYKISSIMPLDYRPEIFYNKCYFLSLALGLVFFTFFYYFLLNFYYKLFSGKKGVIPFLIGSVIAAILLAGYLAVSNIVYPIEKYTNKMITPALVTFSRSLSIILIIGATLLIVYLTYLRDEKKQRKILEAQKLQLEVEKSQANYNFLKAQINPHFLHNTLNFLYAKSLPYSPELSEGILTLSEIMRYALGENNLKNGKAALKDEIEHMRNIIKIHQLRFGNGLQVNFEVNGIVSDATIIPFVLITIVENAFKHGNLKNEEHPIEIKLTIDHDNLYFYCRNKKKTGPKELSTGIGLDNIRKRLDLAYGNQYCLNIKDDTEFYTTQLTINII